MGWGLVKALGGYPQPVVRCKNGTILRALRTWSDAQQSGAVSSTDNQKHTQAGVLMVSMRSVG